MIDVSPPLNLTQLEDRLALVAAELGIPVGRARVMLCSLVISQMLPNAVAVKGGMGVKFRFGEAGTRATADLDVSTQVHNAKLEDEFEVNLAKGWGRVPASRGQLSRDSMSPERVAFTGKLRPRRSHDPGLARPEYVMQPYRVSLAFLGKDWGSLDVEISHPEVGVDAHSKKSIDENLHQFANRFGFGRLRPIELVDLEYQIAQKIHAVTDPTYSRAHDLVDLQILWTANPDMKLVREYCLRTFDFRRQQLWPPIPLRSMRGWNKAYYEAREETEVNGGTFVLPKIADARNWLLQQIELIEES